MSTPKEIAKRIKAKGLNKLRFYCQVCEKSCRDANGYKCHLTTEGHQRAIMVFANNHKSMTEEFSNEFHKSYLDVLRRRAATVPQLANRLYQEVIGDRHHTHMNSTKWGSLTAYLMWLKDQKLATVEENERGLFVTYIDHDPETAKRSEERNRIERAEQRDAMRFDRQLAQRVASLTANAVDEAPKELKAFDRAEHAHSIGFVIPTKRTDNAAIAAVDSTKRKLTAAFGDDNDDEHDAKNDTKSDNKVASGAHASDVAAAAVSKKSRSEEPSDEHRKSHWIKTGLVVKVLNKKLADGAYHKQKGTIVKVIEKLTAEVEMSKSGDVLRIGQAELETVLPSVGGSVLVVNGAHRGSRGTLESLDVDKFCANIKLENGQVHALPYEDVCKIA